ncbi:capsular biosynthesis protein [Paenibacillus sp. YYML68]|uniref:capsular biosynthesis protein n=1 Tax=Paenibacillus sp. YYML68 TaxID=2909250 RepID=UPI002492DAE5|nr:capsular biosynthesis protein [Paenibacillus sp. YYML68]
MRICVDLDGVICELRRGDQKYEDLQPMVGAREKLTMLREAGNYIIIHTARRMRTHHGDVEKVKEDIGQSTIEWLARHHIPYDEIHFGKPWAQVYIDDNAYRFDGWCQIQDNGSSLPPSNESRLK